MRGNQIGTVVRCHRNLSGRKNDRVGEEAAASSSHLHPCPGASSTGLGAEAGTAV